MSEMHARFWVNTVTKQVWSKDQVGGTVKLNAVNRKTDDNIDWAAATPSGTLEMSVNPKALAWFDEHIGEDVLITMTPVEPAQTD